MEKVQQKAGEAIAEDGAVMMDGPDGVAVTMTAEAALETSDRLLPAAMTAMGQDAIKRREAERRPSGTPLID